MRDYDFELLIEDLQHIQARHKAWLRAKELGYDFFSDGDSIDKVHDYTEEDFIEELRFVWERSGAAGAPPYHFLSLGGE